MARRPWVKSRKNDRVFSSLRKRKNFEIFSIRSDGGDIGTGECACRKANIAPRPWVKSRKNDRVFSSLRKRKNFGVFSSCSDRGGYRGAWSAAHALPCSKVQPAAACQGCPSPSTVLFSNE